MNWLHQSSTMQYAMYFVTVRNNIMIYFEYMNNEYTEYPIDRRPTLHGERAAIFKLHFHEFDEKELLRAEFLHVTSLNNFVRF